MAKNRYHGVDGLSDILKQAANYKEEPNESVKQYVPLPTLQLFHDSPAQIRCVVGPVGSGKTTAAAWEICYYLPEFLYDNYGMTKTRWVIVRNSYRELKDTTMKTVFDWFNGPWTHFAKEPLIYTLTYGTHVAEILFRSCDNPDDVKKFKSLEINGYWIDESIEVAEEIKRMLKNRAGRYPSADDAAAMYLKKFKNRWPKEWFNKQTGKREMPMPRFGIETTNPPDVEHPTYSDFKWMTLVPGPMPTRNGLPAEPLVNHEGFWQPPRENAEHLRRGYYEDLRNDYRDNPDWASTYIEGRPGIIISGKLVYNRFKKEHHVAKEPLKWVGGELYRGWDHSGNCPACVVLQIPTARQVHVLAEFHTDRMGIVDFAEMVNMSCNINYPGATWTDFGDPAGSATFSKKEGGFTSNTELIREATGIDIFPSEQNWEARREAVECQLAVYDGILIDPSCVRLINGFIGGYHYKQIAMTGMHSVKPEKNKFSHCLAEGTRIATPYGEIPIERLQPGCTVLTSVGAKTITATMSSFQSVIDITLSSGKTIICTPDHPFVIKNKLVRADALQYNMVLESININCKEVKVWEDHPNILSKNSMVSGFIENVRGIIKRVGGLFTLPSICTDTFGNFAMGLSRPIIAFIISTGIRPTIELKTSNLSLRPNMGETTRQSITLKFQSAWAEASLLLERPLQYGINQMQRNRCTEKQEKNHGSGEKSKNIFVASAIRSTKCLRALVNVVFALLPANLRRADVLAQTMKSGFAVCAGRLLSPTNTIAKEPAEVRVAKVSPLGKQRRVYDLTVEDAHCFYANGILVGNCHDAFQYIMCQLVGKQNVRTEDDVFMDGLNESKEEREYGVFSGLRG